LAVAEFIAVQPGRKDWQIFLNLKFLIWSK